jgi:shikimate kinase
LIFTRVYLIGFKACGKSSVGKKLAENTGSKFIDLDSVIEGIYFERTGERLSFREIHKREGAEYFGKIESEALEKVGELTEDFVLACGGGTPLREENVVLMKKMGKIVLLRVEKEELFKRVMSGGIPAFFKNKENPRESFDELFSEREPVYEGIADFGVDNTNRRPEEVAREIAGKFGE